MTFLERQRTKLKRERDPDAKGDVVAFNHNRDVGVLHFKFRGASTASKAGMSYRCGTKTNRR